eukprot:s6637_g3.t1
MANTDDCSQGRSTQCTGTCLYGFTSVHSQTIRFIRDGVVSVICQVDLMSSPKGGYVGLAGNRPGSYSPTARSPQGSVAFGRGATASTSSNNKLRRMRSNTPTPSDRPATPRASPEETPRSAAPSPVPAAQAPSPPPGPGAAPGAVDGSRQAITIFGCTGKYKLINDTFEPLQMLHQNKPCWRARSATPVYLFHTGKSRWVISKKLLARDSFPFSGEVGTSGYWTTCMANAWPKALLLCAWLPLVLCERATEFEGLTGGRSIGDQPGQGAHHAGERSHSRKGKPPSFLQYDSVGRVPAHLFSLQLCNLAACALGVRFGCASGVLLELDSEATDLNSDTPDPTEEYDGDLGAPILKLPPVPTPAYNKLKFQLSSNGPVETSVQETDAAGDETMKDAEEWRETEKELQQATEDLGKASHKAAEDLQEDTKKLQKARSHKARDEAQEPAVDSLQHFLSIYVSFQRQRLEKSAKLSRATLQQDGARCYAFVSDNGYADPTQCPGPWICCGEDGQWREDRNIKCVPAKASQDKFVLLRNEVEEDLKHFGLMDSNSLKSLWKKLDKNGNGIVSLAEIDSLVVDMVKASLWPEWVNNKDAIRRAYEKTAKLDGDGEGDDVEKEEFHSLLLNLFWFGHLHRIFDEIDSSHDGRLTLEEFTAGMAQLDLHLSPEEARKEYSTIDMDHGGMILFTEFCAYIRRRVHPDHNPAFDADIVSKDKSNETLRKKHGDKATHGHFVNKKSLADFDKLEKELKDVLKANDQAQLKKMWKRLDFNGNNIVSLAEVGKMVNEQYPVLNHQPALMRAFKATLERGNGDEWVQKAEFKMLLGNLFYFNKLYWLFDQVDEDHDRRMTLKEFQWCMSVCGIKMSQAKSEAEFKKVDVNGGGIILFDEFCRYFADKHCPEAMQDFVDGL